MYLWFICHYAGGTKSLIISVKRFFFVFVFFKSMYSAVPFNEKARTITCFACLDLHSRKTEEGY